jgi:hypothetical protein
MPMAGQCTLLVNDFSQAVFNLMIHRIFLWSVQIYTYIHIIKPFISLLWFSLFKVTLAEQRSLSLRYYVHVEMKLLVQHEHAL